MGSFDALQADGAKDWSSSAWRERDFEQAAGEREATGRTVARVDLREVVAERAQFVDADRNRKGRIDRRGHRTHETVEQIHALGFGYFRVHVSRHLYLRARIAFANPNGVRRHP